MKTIRTFLSLFLVFSAVVGFAQTKINGIYYNLYEDGTAEVTFSISKYKGDIIIPQNVTISGITYTVTKIGFTAFHNCIKLTSVVIPNTVTSIGEEAFSGCYSLTSITIPSSVTSISDEAFKMCFSIESITVATDNEIYDSRDNCNAIIEKCTNTLIVGCKNTIIPNSVTSIGDSAFWGSLNLSSITIPSSVISIGKSAFRCTGLTAIDIPNSVKNIEESTFDSCYKLSSINIPNSVERIGLNAFCGCSSLTAITIPTSVVSIENGIFYNCLSLESITVATDNELYDSRDNCNAIIKKSTNALIAGCKNTIIPYSVMSIGKFAFNGFLSLTSIIIPNSVTSIGDYAFCNTGLTTIDIPNSVKSIGNSAFSVCESIQKVVCYAEKIPVTSLSAFDFSPIKSATLYVPVSAIDDYKVTQPWGDFGTICVLNK